MEFGLYVTPVEGRTVRRFGAPPNTYIGAKRVGKQITWDTVRIVGIPSNEYSRFRAEYDGAIADGALKKHTAAEYETQQKARAAKNAAAREAAGLPAKGVRAVAESAPLTSPSGETERPKAFLLGGSR
jgi:hypothetical protein